MKLYWPMPCPNPVAPELPAPWFTGNTYASTAANGTVHTGVDLNLPNYADTGKTIKAAAAGRVTFAGAGALIGWPDARNVVVIQHAQLAIWTRYAHLGALAVVAGQLVSAGDALSVIGDYGRIGPPDDHLHFDIATRNLTAWPGDWPGNKPGALLSVLSGYLNPFVVYRMCNYG